MPPKDDPEETAWAVFLRGGAAQDGPWELRERLTGVCEEPDTAARIVVARHWTSGSHSVLAVGSDSAHEFRITVETDEVLPNA